MSPISAEMNGNVSNQALNSSTNSASNLSNSASKSNSMLEDSNNSDVDGVNFSNSSSCSGGDVGGGPMTTSTPIGVRSFDGLTEQPSSSTENCNFGLSVPKYGTLIPNRVFVGGISCHTTETELMQLFSRFGMVRGSKIIMDRSGLSKGYGFVTFETEDEAKRLLAAMTNREMPPIVHRDRRLNIAPAVKKQPIIQRENTTYGSLSSGCVSSTFSPPPFDSYYYTTGQSPSTNGMCQGELFVPPMQMGEPFFQQQNGFPGSNPMQNGSMGGGPFYAQLPNLGGLDPGQVGTAVGPGPNGNVIFLPLNMPYTFLF